MPSQRLKIGEDELDVVANEEADSGGDFESYDGLIPPSDTVLVTYVKNMWKTLDKNNKYMLKVLAVAADNEGDEAEYNGLTLWGNYSIIPSAKFKWEPFFDQFGITLADAKNKLFVDKDNEHPNFGFPVTKIGRFVPGSEESWCRVITKLTYDLEDNPRAEVKKWLDYEEEEEPVDETEEEVGDEEEEEEFDEGEEDEAVDEHEEEPEPPRRGSRSPGRTSTTRSGAKPAAPRTAAKTSRTPAPATTRTAGRRPARTTSAPAKAAPARGRGRGRAAPSDEPPF